MTLYADLSPATEGSVKAHLSREGDRLIEDSHQQGHSTHRQWRVCPSLGSPSPTPSVTTPLETEGTSHPLRAILLPGGTVSITPCTIPRREAFDLEAAWHLSAHQRQRMIRHYSESGAWTALTLIDEKKLG
ncbi:MAG: hypothetical protein VKL39_02070, partial [Leptolyngbyaceae bacterium]|nr:hypothetical protein [Leptolyngbyaceae bacterium]